MILKVPLTIATLEAEGFHLFIKGHINKKKVNLLLDTGASKTVFDINRISRFIRKSKKNYNSFESRSTGLGTNTMESQFTTAKEFRISELVLPDYCVILLNMAHVNESYATLGIDPIDGVLGSDILMKYSAVIDYKKKLLKLRIR